jgi:hypothetical protein
VAWSPDGASLVSVSGDKITKMWNAKTGECKSGFFVAAKATRMRPVGMRSISYSHTGDTIAAGCDNGKIYLMDPAPFERRLRYLSGHSG